MRAVKTSRPGVLLAVTLLLMGLSVTSTADAAPPRTLRDSVLADARAGILDLVHRTSGDDVQFFENGRFVYPDAPCPRCELGPAVAAAALFRETGDGAMRHVALTALDNAIARQWKADGTWGSASAPTGNDIETMFFAEHVGMALYAFGDTLDATYRSRYLKVLTGSVDALLARKMHTYAMNGNINLGVTVVYGMAWRLSGDERYHQPFLDAMALTIEPSPEYRSQGYGFHRTSPASGALGGAGSGWLAEKGAGSPGFDPLYVQFQSDLATQGYLVTRDERLLTLANQLDNELLRRVDRGTWMLDVSNGSRNTQPDRHDPFLTPALLIASQHGRPELAAAAHAQTAKASAYFRISGTRTWTGIYQSWGTQMATFILETS